MTSTGRTIPWDVLEKISARIINEVQNINRVLYDCNEQATSNNRVGIK